MPEDDGYGEFGGNGSVQWSVDVNNSVWHHSSEKDPGVAGTATGRRQGGVTSTRAGGKLTLSLEVPAGSDVKEFLARLTDAKNWMPDGPNRVAFQLDIEDRNPDQIRILWPSYQPRGGVAGAKSKR